MRIKLHRSIFHLLGILALSLCLTSVQAQEQKDPYKKVPTPATPTAPTAPATPTLAPTVASERPAVEMIFCVTATVEWIDMGNADAMALMRGGLAPNSAELIQKIRELEAQGKATLVDAQSVTTRSGQRATSEGTKEFIYPTEFHPLETKGLSEANVNLASTQVADGQINIQQEALGSSPPTAFEMRPVGGRFELDPVIGEDAKTIELNFAPEYTIFTGWQELGKVRIGGETLPMIEQPHFATCKISTSVVIVSGQTIVAGMTSVQKEDGTIDATQKRLLLVHGLVFPVQAK